VHQSGKDAKNKGNQLIGFGVFGKKQRDFRKKQAAVCRVITGSLKEINSLNEFFMEKITGKKTGRRLH